MTPSTAGVILFDLDGTLIDSERLILASYRHTMQRHLGRVPPESLWKATIGQPLVVQMRMFADRQDQVEAMIHTYTTHNLANHDDFVRPFPGVRPVLEAVRGSGRALGIVTSKRRKATHMGLARCELPAAWFEAIVTADDVERYKPDPEPVLKALELMGRRPSDGMFVGDSTHDMKCGRAAGVMTAAALWGPYTRAQLEPTAPDTWLREPADLLPALGIED